MKSCHNTFFVVHLVFIQSSIFTVKSPSEKFDIMEYHNIVLDLL